MHCQFCISDPTECLCEGHCRSSNCTCNPSKKERDLKMNITTVTLMDRTIVHSAACVFIKQSDRGITFRYISSSRIEHFYPWHMVKYIETYYSEKEIEK
jgi:hypothetical protein